MKIFRLLIFILLIPHYASAYTSYEEKIRCPIDLDSFTISVTGSYTTTETLRDFQQQGFIGFLYENYIHSCPKCHYAGYYSDFKTSFNETDKQEILKVLEPFKDVKPDEVTECEIALLLYEHFKKSNDAIADLYRITSYILKPDPNQKKRKEVQLKAASYYLKAIENKEYKTKKEYATILYLVGELFRRTGDFENAIKYFDMALLKRKKEKWLNDIILEQKKLALNKDENNNV